MDLTPELLDRLKSATFCRPAIAELAELFDGATTGDVSPLVAQLTEQGEEVALNRLLNVCAYKEILVEPTALAESAGVIEDLSDLRFCFAQQDETAIEPLITMARAEILSWQRQAMLGRLAAELAVRHESYGEEVTRLLQYLREEVSTPNASALVYDSVRMLESAELKEAVLPIMIEGDIHSDLPERPPLKVIGGGETVRRPIPKLGRNEPCHCGSGKKYKRCCFEKDQAILADASSYAGITRSALLENPGMVGDISVIHDLRAHEIKKLNPKSLATDQLWTAYNRASNFGLLEVAYAMLVERSKRPDAVDYFGETDFAQLMDTALAHGDIDMAKRARALTPHDSPYVNWDEVDLQFELCANPGYFGLLEARCKQALCSTPDEETGFRDHEFCNLTHLVRFKFPALTILFARAAVQECPDRIGDNELLVDYVHQARIALGLEPWSDPIDAAFDAASEGVEALQASQAMDEAQLREAQALREQLAQSRERIESAEQGLAEKEAALSELKHELEATAAAPAQPEATVTESKEKGPDRSRETVERLRRQVDNLKAEIGNQQEKRQRLRHELERERQRAKRASAARAPSGEQTAGDTGSAPTMPEANARPMVIPEYDNPFRDACQKLPPAVAASAMKAVAAFSVYDSAVWSHARSIKQLTHIYRVRIGIHYRLLLRWIPGQSLNALDLIPRQDLESWIKRHA